MLRFKEELFHFTSYKDFVHQKKKPPHMFLPEDKPPINKKILERQRLTAGLQSIFFLHLGNVSCGIYTNN